MAKCKFPDCKNKILSIAICCNKCNKHFCGVHRLPECHECEFLDEFKSDAFMKNQEILLANKCVKAKI